VAQKYRPAFIADRDLKIWQSMGLYAPRAVRRQQYQYAYYWHKLTHQQGILFDADSHLGDHEADDRSDRLGRCDRPSDVHVLPPPRGQHFWSPSHPSALSAGDGRADPRPAPDRPAVRQLCRRRGHTLAAGVVPRCPRRRRRLSPPDVGDAGASSTQRPMRRVESPHRTGPRIVVGRVDD